MESSVLSTEAGNSYWKPVRAHGYWQDQNPASHGNSRRCQGEMVPIAGRYFEEE
jgi:hypothetical protein